MKFSLSNPFKQSKAPPGFGSGKTIPEGTAPLLSALVFQWLGPFLDVGFSRPLEKEDLWELPRPLLTSTLAEQVEVNFYARCPPEKRPRDLRESTRESGIHSSESNKEKDTDESIDVEELKSKRDLNKKTYDKSLFKALCHTFFTRIWIAGVLKLVSDTLKTITPLLNKVILTWLSESYTYFRASDAQRTTLGLSKPNGIGYGIGLGIALFLMQEAASLMNNHYMQTSLTTGLSVRTGIIGAIFRKSLRLSGRARINHGVGQITTMISADATRLDRFTSLAHNLWVAPIQLAIGIGLLLGNLGYSALVGLGVLLLGLPLQSYCVKIMFGQRKKAVKVTDKRVRLLTETLQGIRLIKFYAWEDFYVRQIGKLRREEIKYVRNYTIARAFLVAMLSFVPILAAVLSFITYALSGHNLDVATIFSSLQLFNTFREPLIYFPMVISGLSDALVALRRIATFLTAEDLPNPYPVDQLSPNALHLDGDFTWEMVNNPIKGGGGKFGKGQPSGVTSPMAGRTETNKGDKPSRKWWNRQRNNKEKDLLPSSLGKDEKEELDTGSEGLEPEPEQPFELKNLKMDIPQGAFVAIVGRVGSGKSSILQAMIGEMRRTRGEVSFGGKISYSPQTPWIRNATFRENVLFGQADNEDRFREVIRACSLDHDLDMLPNGEETEIGEKGINLSGGQKARVSLARAAYSDSQIVLLDDPLSAVDAYVGKSILDDCLLSGPLAKRTRILVTHALHVLDKTDYIYVMDKGVIIEQGTYEDLMVNSVVFSKLLDEFGNLEEAGDVAKSLSDPMKEISDKTKSDFVPKKTGQLMQTEERNTGAVTWAVYRRYLLFAGGVLWVPLILLLLILYQGSQVANNLLLAFWTSTSIPGFQQGDYIAVYASLGLAQSVFSFCLGLVFVVGSLIASLNLFDTSLTSVLRSPLLFFDTTPMGRILSRLSKDQDTLDTEISLYLMTVLQTASTVLGTAGLVFYIFPYLGILFLPLSIFYYIVSLYYRHSSVETKRLDSLMRSVLYSSVSETLTGLATIRAYREQDRSIAAADGGLDLENKAYYMTVSIQRWLAIRLDFFGNILILGICLFASGFRNSTNPAKIGVILSYTLGITQMLSDIVSQFAQIEQNMNAVERVLHYTDLESEGEANTPNDPPPSWPSEGEIAFSNVELAYRKGLPLVLKDVSFQVKAGEKVGIVGRTGAGKSSLLHALFRTVELRGGKVEIDGQNIRDMGLNVLRARLALVPQDVTLFLGTLRENLDPQRLRTDAELISVLQRAWLLPRDGTSDPAAEAKFSLDSTVGDEGANFSSGEKQLLSLCRALVKNSKIIVLDEATSNVDVETDAKLQRTIQIEFASSTLLCIAHRLNTIAYYDRVLVMDEGKIAEFDTVLNLFDKQDSIFRALCDEANLQRTDIIKIRSEHSKMIHSVERQ